MSILTKPYEISVWRDAWDTNKSSFVEKRLGIIGSNKMSSQNRALEPTLVRNVNGTKKFSFQMYSQYIDNATGELVYNPFVKWLVSERKIKLKYEKDDEGKDHWYDFVIKDISENSATHLNTYQLEDALVQELSKNGFGVVLDAEVSNNMDTAAGLASEVLKGTGWNVDSEVFVEKVDEALVYVTIPDMSNWPEEGKNKKIYKLTDSNEQELLKNGLGIVEDTTPNEGTVLAFYSSCRNKPRRFQFIYLSDYNKTKVSVNRDRQIIEKDCQYYIEFEEEDYPVKDDDDYGFFLPKGFKVTTHGDTTTNSGDNDTTISTWYRGTRYGFAQKAEYVPLLKRYCQLYKDSSDNKYYGYVDNEYLSPNFVVNLVSNTDFESKAGWVGATTGNIDSKAEIENVYGQFVDEENGKKFVSSIDYLKGVGSVSTSFDDFLKLCKPYLKITLKDTNSLVLNNGPYENRTLIKNMEKGSKWALRATVRGESGAETSNVNIVPGEYKYDETNEKYSTLDSPSLGFNKLNKHGEYDIYQVESQYPNEADFKNNSKVKIAITGNAGTYYIENLEFFEAHFVNDELITLDPTQQANAATNLIIPTYRIFEKNGIAKITEADKIPYVYESDRMDYTTYTPIYNDNGEKTRAVNAKESNYFNILQSIAETFECWVDLVVTRDEKGGINNKTVKLKNYAGKNNYAAIRYGVNLKDIQRTHSSKNIVTKLMVKPNSNEHGEDGFCTIQRANANITGESYIYDFSYFQNMGLIDTGSYLDLLYSSSGAKGPDIIDSNDEINLKGYFPRLRAINDKLISKNKIINQYASDLLELNAQLSIQVAKNEAAEKGLEEATEDFLALTGITPNKVVNNELNTSSANIDSTKVGYDEDDKYGEVTFTQKDFKDSKLTIIATRATYEATATLYATVPVKITLVDGTEITSIYEYEFQFDGTSKDANSARTIKLVDFDSPDVINYLEQYSTYKQQLSTSSTQKEALNGQIDTKKTNHTNLAKEIDTLLKQKKALNELFFKTYSRFIQEGTWLSEEYYDDEKYYNDALSVMYNSCYPQVAYTINTLEVSQIPGYELFNFDIGDKTYVEDGEFFGYTNGVPNREEIIIAEKTENLDDASKNSNRVQNFKNQFQDLFQKITATTQQVQYSSGAYERGAALAKAMAEDSVTFLNDTLAEMTTNLSNPDLVSESIDKSSQLKIVDGKLLIGSRDDATGDISWRTGLSSKGISADLITAGRINTGQIQIMSGNAPMFRWDAKGISAYDYSNSGTKSEVNTSKFVRFDKFGLYGIDGNADGASWSPASNDQIDEKATFALTWQGLKITGNNGVEARIGKQQIGKQDYIIYIQKKTSNVSDNIFSVSVNGEVYMKGKISAGDGDIAGWQITPGALYKESASTDDNQNFIVHLQSPSTFDTGTLDNPSSDASNRVLTVGAGEKNTDGTYKSYPFYLTSGGFLHTEKLHATGGKFGELEIRQGKFAWEGFPEMTDKTYLWLAGKYKEGSGEKNDCNFFMRADGYVGQAYGGRWAGMEAGRLVASSQDNAITIEPKAITFYKGDKFIVLDYDDLYAILNPSNTGDGEQQGSGTSETSQRPTRPGSFTEVGLT